MKPFGTLVRLKQAIGFDAVDGKPVDIIFLLLLPAQTQSNALNALANVARKLREPELPQRLRDAADASELHSAIMEGVN
jgi:nitrogen PTS system EIIA component